MFGGPFFVAWSKILLLDESLKFSENFQKVALKLLKYEKLWENFQKNAKSHEKFRFFKRNWEI